MRGARMPHSVGTIRSSYPGSPWNRRPRNAFGNTTDCCPGTNVTRFPLDSVESKLGSQRMPRFKVSFRVSRMSSCPYNVKAFEYRFSLHADCCCHVFGLPSRNSAKEFPALDFPGSLRMSPLNDAVPPVRKKELLSSRLRLKLNQ